MIVNPFPRLGLKINGPCRKRLAQLHARSKGVDAQFPPFWPRGDDTVCISIRPLVQFTDIGLGHFNLERIKGEAKIHMSVLAFERFNQGAQWICRQIGNVDVALKIFRDTLANCRL